MAGTTISSTIPAGVILPYAGTLTGSPEGWLLCNGATVSRYTFKNLFIAIGTTYGSGDGSTTFHLPNLNTASGPFIRGGTGPSGASIVSDTTKPNGLSNSNESANHTHSLSSASGSISSATANAGTAHTHSLPAAGVATHSHGTFTSGYSIDNINHAHALSGAGAGVTGGGHSHSIQSLPVGGLTPGAGAFIAYTYSAINQSGYFSGSDGTHSHGFTGSTGSLDVTNHRHSTDISGSGDHGHSNIANENTHTHPVTGSITVSSLSLNNQSANHVHTLTGDSETAPRHMVMQYIIKT